MSSALQSNTRKGPIVIVPNANLTGKEGFLAKLVAGTGQAKAALTGAGAQAQFVVLEGGDVTGNVSLQPLNTDQNVRVVAAVAIAGGGEVASDTNGKATTATSGDWVVGIAEADAAIGDYAIIRPVIYKKA